MDEFADAILPSRHYTDRMYGKQEQSIWNATRNLSTFHPNVQVNPDCSNAIRCGDYVDAPSIVRVSISRMPAMIAIGHRAVEWVTQVMFTFCLTRLRLTVFGMMEMRQVSWGLCGRVFGRTMCSP